MYRWRAIFRKDGVVHIMCCTYLPAYTNGNLSGDQYKLVSGTFYVFDVYFVLSWKLLFYYAFFLLI